MKKAIIYLMSILLLTGCTTDMSNTPTKKTEMFFENYQMLDESVLDDLDKVVAEEESFNTEQREKYEDIMKNHYKDLKYSIKDEVIDGDNAIVTVEITVNDFHKVMEDAKDYLANNPDKFNDESGEYSEKLYVDYQLEKLEEAKDTVKYTIDVNLTKKDDSWSVNDLSTTEYEKINGIYAY